MDDAGAEGTTTFESPIVARTRLVPAPLRAETVDRPGLVTRRSASPARLGVVAALLMTGSFLFALGSFPPYSQNIDPGTVGLTFVVGSVVFTAAGYGAFVQVINDDDSVPVRYRPWQPSSTVW